MPVSTKQKTKKKAELKPVNAKKKPEPKYKLGEKAPDMCLWCPFVTYNGNILWCSFYKRPCKNAKSTCTGIKGSEPRPFQFPGEM